MSDEKDKKKPGSSFFHADEPEESVIDDAIDMIEERLGEDEE